MPSFLLFAELPAITPFERLAGTSLAVMAFLVAGYLWFAQRKWSRRKTADEQTNATAASDSGAIGSAERALPHATVSSGPRKVSAALLLACALAVLVGVWIDPRQVPIYFLIHWSLTMLLVIALFVAALYDLATVRRHALRAKTEMLAKNKDRLAKDIEAYQHAREQAKSVHNGTRKRPG